MHTDINKQQWPVEFTLEKLKQYIQSTILPSIGQKNASFSVQPTHFGKRNIIIFLFIDGFLPLVFKGFRKKNRIKKSLLGTRVLIENNINTPKVYFSDISWGCFRKFGYYFLCEEKIDGKSLSEIKNISPFISSIAQHYAKMHQVRNTRWGNIPTGTKRDFNRYIIRQISRWLQSLQQNKLHRLTEKNVQNYLKWFQEQISLKKINNFSLCHGDVNRKNIFISDKNEIFSIDNESVKFFPFLVEFFRLLFSLCHDNPNMIEVFKKHYFESVDEEGIREFYTFEKFFEAYVLLEFAHYFSSKLLKDYTDKNELSNYYKKSAEWALSALKNQIE